MVTKEQGIEVCSASAGLQGEDSPAVLRKVEVLEHVEGLDNHGEKVFFHVWWVETCAGILGRLM